MSHFDQHLARSFWAEICLVCVISKYAADSDIFSGGGRCDSYGDFGVSIFSFWGSMTSDETSQRVVESCFALGSCFAACKVVCDR